MGAACLPILSVLLNDIGTLDSKSLVEPALFFLPLGRQARSLYSFAVSTFGARLGTNLVCKLDLIPSSTGMGYVADHDILLGLPQGQR